MDCWGMELMGFVIEQALDRESLQLGMDPLIWCVELADDEVAQWSWLGRVSAVFRSAMVWLGKAEIAALSPVRPVFVLPTTEKPCPNGSGGIWDDATWWGVDGVVLCTDWICFNELFSTRSIRASSPTFTTSLALSTSLHISKSQFWGELGRNGDDGFSLDDDPFGDDDLDDLELFRLALFLDAPLLLSDIGDPIWREGWLEIGTCGITICCVPSITDCTPWIWMVWPMLLWS